MPTFVRNSITKIIFALHQNWEEKLLKKISKAYYLPAWVPPSEYVAIAHELGLQDVRVTDWSEFVLPFWPAVIRSALVPGNFFRMVRSGMTTVKGAIASLWMRRGLKKKVICFALITGKKKSLEQLKEADCTI